jgi:hypothetical protein
MADQEVPAVRVYQIKVTLRDLEPPIWRRVLVRSDMTLKGLHNVLQVVMDWEGYHMHEFAIGKRRIGVPDKENFTRSRTRAGSSSIRLSRGPGANSTISMI